MYYCEVWKMKKNSLIRLWLILSCTVSVPVLRDHHQVHYKNPPYKLNEGVLSVSGKHRLSKCVVHCEQIV